MTHSYFWYDYETTGIDARRDRVVQFAGIRTDLDFNPVGQPLNLYCQLHDDILPHPEACLVTGISPQLANQKGLPEPEFMSRIHAQFSQPGTCVVGYNNLRFDDEFTRNGLYRNFFDPYAREWKSGNSRWDLIDVARMTEALRPDGIVWPQREDGAPSFRLEELTAANGIVHKSAHDALSDVYATIGLAKLIRERQPRLFDWAFGLRVKQKPAELLNPQKQAMLLHVSGKYPANRHSLAVIVPLVQHPTNGNGMVVYDLSVNPKDLLQLSVEQIRERLYTSRDDLPPEQDRIPLKTIHINKSPMLAPLSTLTEQARQRLQLDLDLCEQHRQQLLAPELADKVRSVFDQPHPEPGDDPDLMLYSGGFFSPADQRRMETIRQTEPHALAELSLNFEDERLPEMLFRYRARNYPQTLTADEAERWQDFRRQRLTRADGGGSIILEDYFQRLDQLVAESHWTEAQVALIESLIEYGEQLMAGLDDRV